MRLADRGKRGQRLGSGTLRLDQPEIDMGREADDETFKDVRRLVRFEIAWPIAFEKRRQRTGDPDLTGRPVSDLARGFTMSACPPLLAA
ncbi:hypothetical protein [Mesorhizobium sp.]|uniref:hypothetical protein n=1 Tax=Mesorhizobium sp. TaxID=1871066 RepID=UPI0026D7AE91